MDQTRAEYELEITQELTRLLAEQEANPSEYKQRRIATLTLRLKGEN